MCQYWVTKSSISTRRIQLSSSIKTLSWCRIWIQLCWMLCKTRPRSRKRSIFHRAIKWTTLVWSLAPKDSTKRDWRKRQAARSWSEAKTHRRRMQHPSQMMKMSSMCSLLARILRVSDAPKQPSIGSSQLTTILDRRLDMSSSWWPSNWTIQLLWCRMHHMTSPCWLHLAYHLARLLSYLCQTILLDSLSAKMGRQSEGCRARVVPAFR